MQINVDYKFRDDLFDSEKATLRGTVPLELLLGVYKGVVWRYNEVAISEEFDGTATMKFRYDILEVPPECNKTTEDLEVDPIFTQVLGNILNTLILESVMDADRKDDIEELDSERGLLSESFTLPQG